MTLDDRFATGTELPTPALTLISVDQVGAALVGMIFVVHYRMLAHSVGDISGVS